MLGIRRQNGAYIGKRLSACRKDIAALQKDTVLLAEDIAAIAADGTSRFRDQAYRASRNVRATLPRRSRGPGLLRPIAIALFSIGSAALLGTFFVRR